jgi:hypothetical protein
MCLGKLLFYKKTLEKSVSLLTYLKANKASTNDEQKT